MGKTENYNIAFEKAEEVRLNYQEYGKFYLYRGATFHLPKKINGCDTKEVIQKMQLCLIDIRLRKRNRVGIEIKENDATQIFRLSDGRYLLRHNNQEVIFEYEKEDIQEDCRDQISSIKV